MSASPVHSTAPGLHWGVKQSFVGYIRGVGGDIECTDGAMATDSGYWFPAAETAETAFVGTLRFRAHGGLLNVDIRDPRLRMLPDAIELSVGDATGARLAVARAPLGTDAELIDELRLLPDACALFNFTYPPDTLLDAARLAPAPQSAGGPVPSHVGHES
ncbi:HtaA domain-containing protein [Microbacterium aquimaris]|uniref:HtaA domain-containing protein n=1 Tax=Microbacterium aquimaris TaxID=459816 RepID=UPI002AD53AD7|nr:HtaA domain-containing protein [Microbacterium aquimaris]MDZ8275051.1 HtaA domain-containing protein [Microbacterium aquimaris]